MLFITSPPITIDLSLINHCFINQGIPSELYYKIFHYIILGKYMVKMINCENLYLFYFKAKCFECHLEIIIKNNTILFTCRCKFECESKKPSKSRDIICQNCVYKCVDCKKVICRNSSDQCDGCEEFICDLCQPEQCEECNKVCCVSCCKVYDTKFSRCILQDFLCYHCLADIFVDAKSILEQYKEIDVSSLSFPNFGTIRDLKFQ
jgi:hypothetical protein